MIVIGPRRTQQPQSAATVNWGNPFSLGLEVLQSGRTYYRSAKTQTLSIVAGSPVIGASSQGSGPQFSSGAQRLELDSVGVLTNSQGFTIEVLCVFTAAPSLAGFFCAPSDGANGSGRGLIAFAGGNSRNIYFWGNAGDLSAGVDWRVDGSPQHVFVTSAAGSGSAMTFYRDGLVIATGTTPTIATRSAVGNWALGDTGQGWNSVPTGTIVKSAFYRRALSAAEIASLSVNPWQIFAPPARRLWVAGGTAHATTGALTGPGSGVAGAAARTRNHPATGILAGPGSTIAGAAIHQLLHTTTGALTGPGSAVAGAAARTRNHPTTGVLAGAGSTVSGTAARFALHTTTGALTGPGSTAAGSAARVRAFATSGALTGPGSTIAGSAARAGSAVSHATTGALTGPGSTTAGTAARTRDHPATGALAGPGSTTAGAAARLALHATTGALTGPGATLAGSAARTRAFATSGALAGPGSTIAGSAARTRAHPASGALTGSGSSLSGTAARLALHTTTGALTGQGSTAAGLAARTRAHPTSGALTGPGSAIASAAARAAAGSVASAAAVWAHVMANGQTAEANVLAILAALTGPALPVDVRYVNGVQIKGTGVPGNTWGPV